MRLYMTQCSLYETWFRGVVSVSWVFSVVSSRNADSALSVPLGVCDGLGHYTYLIPDVAIQEVCCGEVRWPGRPGNGPRVPRTNMSLLFQRSCSSSPAHSEPIVQRWDMIKMSLYFKLGAHSRQPMLVRISQYGILIHYYITVLWKGQSSNSPVSEKVARSTAPSRWRHRVSTWAGPVGVGGNKPVAISKLTCTHFTWNKWKEGVIQRQLGYQWARPPNKSDNNLPRHVQNIMVIFFLVLTHFSSIIFSQNWSK
jgi:hypothetical protein